MVRVFDVVFKRRLTFSNSAPSDNLSISCSRTTTFWLICGQRNRISIYTSPQTEVQPMVPTYISQFSLGHLQLHPPARLLLLHTALKALQDALLWMKQAQQPWTCEQHSNLRVNMNPKQHGLTVSAKTLLYVSQSFCRILCVSSASFSFFSSPWWWSRVS